jgi:hypothetical protein
MLFSEVFQPESLTIQTHGNVLAALASLHGLISKELRREELNHHDRDYELVITIRAVKGGKDSERAVPSTTGLSRTCI